MRKIFVFILFLITPVVASAATDSCLEKWMEFSHSSGKKVLTGWIRETALNILSGKKNYPVTEITLPAEPDCTGMFITLIKKGKVRGCYGAFNHMYSSPSLILRDYINGALYLDHRYRPLEKHELDETEIVLTVTSNPEPVDDINNVDITNFGLFIECEDSPNTVIVPAEYKTSAGIIRHTGRTGCRFYRFRSVTIK